MTVPALAELRAAWDRRPLFDRCLAASVALHGLLFIGGVQLPPVPRGTPVEIDLTDPFPGGGPAKLAAPKRRVPGAPVGAPLPAEPDARLSTQKPRDWTLPGPKTKVVETPPENVATPGGTETGTGISPIPGGAGAGAPYGAPGGLGSGGSPPIKPPRLLNRDEVLASLRRFYPERERLLGREGVVRLAVHVGVDGGVTASDVLVPASPLFDEAAKKVAQLMRFAPAEAADGRPVPVKISQDMLFKLTDD